MIKNCSNYDGIGCLFKFFYFLKILYVETFWNVDLYKQKAGRNSSLSNSIF